MSPLLGGWGTCGGAGRCARLGCVGASASIRARLCRAICSWPCGASATGMILSLAAPFQGGRGGVGLKARAGSMPLAAGRGYADGAGRLGAAARCGCAARIIAVTGSVGKTTEKEMLRRMLAGFGRGACRRGQFTTTISACRSPWRGCRAAPPSGFRDRHEPSGRDRAAGRPGAAGCGDHHLRGARAYRADGLHRGDRREKAQLLRWLEPGGVAVFPADPLAAALVAGRRREATRVRHVRRGGRG